VRDREITQADWIKAKKQAKSLVCLWHGRRYRPGVLAGICREFFGYTWYENYVEQLEAVTLDEVNEAAGVICARTADRGMVIFRRYGEGDQ